MDRRELKEIIAKLDSEAQIIERLGIANLKIEFNEAFTGLAESKTVQENMRSELQNAKETKKQAEVVLLMSGELDGVDPVTKKSSKDYRSKQIEEKLAKQIKAINDAEKSYKEVSFNVDKLQDKISLLRNLSRLTVAELNLYSGREVI